MDNFLGGWYCILWHVKGQPRDGGGNVPNLSINSLQILNHENCCRVKYTIIKFPIVMSCGYSGKFLCRQCKIQLSRDNLGEQKVLKSAFFRLSESLKLCCHLWDILGPLQTCQFWVIWRLQHMAPPSPLPTMGNLVPHE